MSEMTVDSDDSVTNAYRWLRLLKLLLSVALLLITLWHALTGPGL